MKRSHVCLQGALVSMMFAGCMAGADADPIGTESVVASPAQVAAPLEGAAFGWAVALSADGETLAVGAPWEAFDGGGVHIYRKRDASWIEEAYVQAGGPGVSRARWLGYGLGLSGDGATLVIGAPGEHVNDGAGHAETAGAAYVVTRAGNGWGEPVRLGPPVAHAAAAFGWQVAISGDGATIAIGAPFGARPDDSAWNAGAVYTFERSGESWSPSDELRPALEGDAFGSSVAVSGDGATLVVGAPGGGAAWVFGNDAGTWRERTRLAADDRRAAFGSSVAVSADGATIAIGALAADPGTRPGAGKGLVDSGAVHVFGIDRGAVALETIVAAPDYAAGDEFGMRVALSADGATLAIGSPGTDASAAVDAGVAHLFARRDGVWSGRMLSATSGEHEGLFGASVALSADASVLAIGAIGEDALYLF